MTMPGMGVLIKKITPGQKKADHGKSLSER
jgi:hypothetical protein